VIGSHDDSATGVLHISQLRTANTMTKPTPDLARLALDIKRWGVELGFQQIGIADTALPTDEKYLRDWLQAKRHGEMAYMAHHGDKRSRPQALWPGTVRVISARMDYDPPRVADAWQVMDQGTLGFVSRYALGRDYHKVLRRRLARLGQRIEAAAGDFQTRAFVDSAPVLEKALANKAGLGWIGKHSNLINRGAGSWFFLGELYTNLPLPLDTPSGNHCGSCRRCLDICPTDAIVAPYQVDARRCISYLTIELKGSIPLDLRPLVGNRIYGCDDCQLVCPWNKFACKTAEADFLPRHGLDNAALVDLFAWDEDTFLARTVGSPIRRIGHTRWLRNIAVALGNAPSTPTIVEALRQRSDHPSPLVREHVQWALQRHASA